MIIPFALLPDVGFNFAALLFVLMQQLPMSLQHMHEPCACYKFSKVSDQAYFCIKPLWNGLLRIIAVAAAAHLTQASPHHFVRLRQLRSASAPDESTAQAQEHHDEDDTGARDSAQHRRGGRTGHAEEVRRRRTTRGGLAANRTNAHKQHLHEV